MARQVLSIPTIFPFSLIKVSISNKFVTIQVDLATVATTLGYKNVNSAANRFRTLRKQYGFESLECKTAGFSAPSTPSATTTAAGTEASTGAATPTPKKRGRGRTAAPANGATPTKGKGTARKGAKVSTTEPIPATGSVIKKEITVKTEKDEGLESDEADAEGDDDDAYC
ncbi:hypothetical protein BJY04DRAFT_182414 [Aspergillus karnatakaensis]|uniref:uncharacterized protein n=1 Tax=Aspergillus karnatakaensis TaxID=1810916 RepID=UPI003CCCECC1